MTMDRTDATTLDELWEGFADAVLLPAMPEISPALKAKCRELFIAGAAAVFELVGNGVEIDDVFTQVEEAVEGLNAH